jgi:hypothetical protein
VIFEPGKHPRDVRGRWRRTIFGLRKGESAELPDGVKVTKQGDGTFRVKSPTAVDASFKTDAAAADHSLELSAKHDLKGSLGGAKKHESVSKALAAERRKARRKAKTSTGSAASAPKAAGADDQQINRTVRRIRKAQPGVEVKVGGKTTIRTPYPSGNLYTVIHDGKKVHEGSNGRMAARIAHKHAEGSKVEPAPAKETQTIKPSTQGPAEPKKPKLTLAAVRSALRGGNHRATKSHSTSVKGWHTVDSGYEVRPGKGGSLRVTHIHSSSIVKPEVAQERENRALDGYTKTLKEKGYEVERSGSDLIVKGDLTEHHAQLRQRHADAKREEEYAKKRVLQLHERLKGLPYNSPMRRSIERDIQRERTTQAKANLRRTTLEDQLPKDEPTKSEDKRNVGQRITDSILDMGKAKGYTGVHRVGGPNGRIVEIKKPLNRSLEPGEDPEGPDDPMTRAFNAQVTVKDVAALALGESMRPLDRDVIIVHQDDGKFKVHAPAWGSSPETDKVVDTPQGAMTAAREMFQTTQRLQAAATAEQKVTDARGPATMAHLKAVDEDRYKQILSDYGTNSLGVQTSISRAMLRDADAALREHGIDPTTVKPEWTPKDEFDLRDAKKRLKAAKGPTAAQSADRTIKRLEAKKAAAGSAPTSLPPDTIDVGSDVNRAADLLAQGKRVHLDQPKTASVLLEELAKRVNAAKAKGDKAPVIDLCKVTVRNTNLFCAESKGIPRVKMPQLSGVPVPGSRADALPKNEKGEVSLGALFRQHLADSGVVITDTDVPAARLKASQIELNGGKVAGMTQTLDSGGQLGGDPRIFVSSDEYIVDGHHRWAANVAHDANDNKLGDHDMPVAQVDMDIISLLDESNRFAVDWGIPQASVAAEVPKGGPPSNDTPLPDGIQVRTRPNGTRAYEVAFGGKMFKRQSRAGDYRFASYKNGEVKWHKTEASAKRRGGEIKGIKVDHSAAPPARVTNPQIGQRVSVTRGGKTIEGTIEHVAPNGKMVRVRSGDKLVPADTHELTPSAVRDANGNEVRVGDDIGIKHPDGGFAHTGNVSSVEPDGTVTYSPESEEVHGLEDDQVVHASRVVVQRRGDGSNPMQQRTSLAAQGGSGPKRYPANARGEYAVRAGDGTYTIRGVDPRSGATRDFEKGVSPDTVEARLKERESLPMPPPNFAATPEVKQVKDAKDYNNKPVQRYEVKLAGRTIGFVEKNEYMQQVTGKSGKIAIGSRKVKEWGLVDAKGGPIGGRYSPKRNNRAGAVDELINLQKAAHDPKLDEQADRRLAEARKRTDANRHNYIYEVQRQKDIRRQMRRIAGTEPTSQQQDAQNRPTARPTLKPLQRPTAIGQAGVKSGDTIRIQGGTATYQVVGKPNSAPGGTTRLRNLDTGGEFEADSRKTRIEAVGTGDGRNLPVQPDTPTQSTTQPAIASLGKTTPDHRFNNYDALIADPQLQVGQSFSWSNGRDITEQVPGMRGAGVTSIRIRKDPQTEAETGEPWWSVTATDRNGYTFSQQYEQDHDLQWLERDMRDPSLWQPGVPASPSTPAPPTAAPPRPSRIAQIDPGAEYMRTLPDGSTAWATVVSPPSGIEQDMVYISSPSGKVRKATEADFGG